MNFKAIIKLLNNSFKLDNINLYYFTIKFSLKFNKLLILNYLSKFYYKYCFNLESRITKNRINFNIIWKVIEQFYHLDCTGFDSYNIIKYKKFDFLYFIWKIYYWSPYLSINFFNYNFYNKIYNIFINFNIYNINIYITLINKFNNSNLFINWNYIKFYLDYYFKVLFKFFFNVLKCIYICDYLMQILFKKRWFMLFFNTYCIIINY